MATTVERFVCVTLTTQNYAILTMERAPAYLVGKETIVHLMWMNALMKICTPVLQIRSVRIQKERFDASVKSGSTNLDMYA